MSDETPPAGWFTDPADPSKLRYWDGDRWTEHVSPAKESTESAAGRERHGRVAQAAGPASAEELAGLDLPPDRSGRWKPIAVFFLALTLLALMGAVAWALLAGSDDSGESVETIAPPTSATVAPAVSSTIAPPSSASSLPAPTTSITTTTSTTTTIPLECNAVRAPLDPVRFTDVGGMSEEAGTAIRWASMIGLVRGEGELFRPGDPMSRAEAITVLWRYYCRPKPAAAAAFGDVPVTAYYREAVEWAAGLGLVASGADVAFAPSESVTRAQMVAMIWRAFGSPTGSPPAPFADISPGVFYSDSIDWGFDTGLISGSSPTTFAPDVPLDRLTAIVLFWRLETKLDPPVG